MCRKIPSPRGLGQRRCHIIFYVRFIFPRPRRRPDHILCSLHIPDCDAAHFNLNTRRATALPRLKIAVSQMRQSQARWRARAHVRTLPQVREPAVRVIE